MFFYFIVEFLHFQLWLSSIDEKYICMVGLIIGGDELAEKKALYIRCSITVAHRVTKFTEQQHQP